MSPPKLASSFLHGLPSVSLWVFFSSRLFSSSTSFKFKFLILQPVFPASTSWRVIPYFLWHQHSVSSNYVLPRVARLSWWGWWWKGLQTGVCSDATFSSSSSPLLSPPSWYVVGSGPLASVCRSIVNSSSIPQRKPWAGKWSFRILVQPLELVVAPACNPSAGDAE